MIEMYKEKTSKVLNLVIIVIILFVLGNFFISEHDRKAEEAKRIEKLEQEKINKINQKNKLKDIHIEVLESDKTYEEMTPKERTAAIEITGDYWDKLTVEQQKKYSSRKQIILDTKKEAVEKWNSEKDAIEKWNSEKNNTNELPKNNISKMKFGELLSSIVNGKTLIIKAKISPSFSNKTTIDQNGYNVEDIILNQGGDSFDEIQYWAVADMNDGSEGKVISFTLNKDQINSIKNKQLVGNKIVDNANDVWVLPSLLK